MTEMATDPVDPDAGLYEDATEGVMDGLPVPSQDGSELMAGGEE